jgi:hypothetical protein
MVKSENFVVVDLTTIKTNEWLLVGEFGKFTETKFGKQTKEFGKFGKILYL